MLKLKGEWTRVRIDDGPTVKLLHLFPRFYNTAFCGLEMETVASGLPFRRERPLASDATPRCENCVSAAARSTFNRADAK